jgi:hypothetical protein
VLLARYLLSGDTQDCKPFGVVIGNIELLVQPLKSAVHLVVQILLPPLSGWVAEEHAAAQRSSLTRGASPRPKTRKRTRAGDGIFDSFQSSSIEYVREFDRCHEEVVLHLLKLAAATCLGANGLMCGDDGVGMPIEAAEMRKQCVILLRVVGSGDHGFCD